MKTACLLTRSFSDLLAAVAPQKIPLSAVAMHREAILSEKTISRKVLVLTASGVSNSTMPQPLERPVKIRYESLDE